MTPMIECRQLARYRATSTAKIADASAWFHPLDCHYIVTQFSYREDHPNFC